MRVWRLPCHVSVQALSTAGERTQRCAEWSWTSLSKGWRSYGIIWVQIWWDSVVLSGAQMRGEARIVNHSSGARAQPNKVLDVTGRRMWRALIRWLQVTPKSCVKTSGKMIDHLCGFFGNLWQQSSLQIMLGGPLQQGIALLGSCLSCFATSWSSSPELIADWKVDFSLRLSNRPGSIWGPCQSWCHVRLDVIFLHVSYQKRTVAKRSKRKLQDAAAFPRPCWLRTWTFPLQPF